LKGDPIYIRFILLSLLSNAIKNAEKGVISLEITGEKALSPSNEIMLLLTISSGDQGRKQELTEPKLAPELVAAHRYIEAMNGSFSAMSQLGKTVIILPQEVACHENLAQVVNPAIPLDTPAGAPPGVLIYERREHCVLSLTRALDSLGVKYAVVSTPSEFSEKITNYQFNCLFVATIYYSRVKKTFPHLEADINIVLLEEYGVETVDYFHPVLTMPIYSIPVADTLNNLQPVGRLKQESPFATQDVRVLAVDDVYVNLQITAGYLTPYAVAVDFCLNGADALEKLRHQQYDLIFMDQMMPGLDGIETAARIRAMGVTAPGDKHLPIIALTACLLPGIRESIINAGMDDFVSKPLDGSKLYRIMEKWIPIEKRVNEGKTSNPVAEANSVLAIEGLDVARGVAFTGGKMEHYLETLLMFMDEGALKAEELKDNLAEENITSFTINVHALKTVLANVGATELSGAAKALEEASRKEDRAFIRTHSAPFLAELEALIRNMKKAVQPRSTDTVGTVHDIETLRPVLVTLRNALQKPDFKQIQETANLLEPYVSSEGPGAEIGQVLRHILMSDYGDAAALLEKY
jgi:CheY-like chemotaxis protein